MPKAFDTDLFTYLNDLAANNERDWFKANKKRYEHSVKEPALDFIESFRPRLADISPHFEANARVVGGSLFRINRDTRFSKDKTPYKIHTGMHFRHERAKDVHAPGFYLHLQPRECFMGSGIWHPEPKVAQQIRGFMAEHRERWTDVTSNLGSFELAGDSLKRPPRGFDAEDPLIDDLKRKDFMTTASFTHKQITSAGFLDLFETRCRETLPFLEFLCDALELKC
jgi:uncharacterized protein (TIGR02453 family)